MGVERQQTGLTTFQAYSFFLCHFLSTWNARSYEFAAVSTLYNLNHSESIHSSDLGDNRLFVRQLYTGITLLPHPLSTSPDKLYIFFHSLNTPITASASLTMELQWYRQEHFSDSILNDIRKLDRPCTFPVTESLDYHFPESLLCHPILHTLALPDLRQEGPE